MKKFMIISPKNRPTYNFRGDLLKAIKAKGYEVVAIGPNTENQEEIEALGVRLIVVPFDKNGTSVAGDIRYYKRLLKVIKEEKPDVSLGYTIKPSIYGAMAAKKAGVACVNSMVTGAGYTFTSKTLKARVLHFIVSKLYKRGFKRADNVFFQNEDDRDEFVSEKLVKREKCVVVNGSGVNMAKYLPKDYPDRLTFFMLSRVMHSKGVPEYLEAARIVKEKRPEIRFMLLGAIEEIQDSLPRTTVQGFVDEGIIEYFGETKDVTPYFAECSVFVLPSHREGTPRTVLEAMSMRRPVITTDAPGCRSTVEDGVNGFLVPVGDPKALAEAMLRFADDPSLVDIMGAESLRICGEKFDVHKVNEKMLEVMKI